MADIFESYSTGLESPAFNAEAITPSDSVDLAQTTRAVYVGGAGTVVAIVNGVAITVAGATAGSFLPIRATRINATSTTATNLVAVW